MATGPSGRGETPLRRLLVERRLSQTEAIAVLQRRARAMGVTSFTVEPRQFGRWIRGEVTTLPRPAARRVLEAEFGVPVERLLGLGLQPLVPPNPPSSPGPLDELEEMTYRAQRAAVSNVDAATLARCGSVVDDLADAYEAGDAHAVAPAALRQRRWIEELLRGSQPLRSRVELYALAARLSALLGYLAFDRGSARVASAYCDEALSLAEEAGHVELCAWIRSIQSFIAFYSAGYHDAATYAQEGLRLAHGGRQQPRLEASSYARALACLGDRGGVDRAVERAIESRDRFGDDQSPGRFLSLGPLAPARLYGNAASAYLALADRERTTYYADLATATFSTGDSPASHALTLLDVTAANLLPGGDPEVAVESATTAVQIGGTLHSAVVARRCRAVLEAGSEGKSHPLQPVLPELRAWADQQLSPQ